MPFYASQHLQQQHQKYSESANQNSFHSTVNAPNDGQFHHAETFCQQENATRFTTTKKLVQLDPNGRSTSSTPRVQLHQVAGSVSGRVPSIGPQRALPSLQRMQQQPPLSYVEHHHSRSVAQQNRESAAAPSSLSALFDSTPLEQHHHKLQASHGNSQQQRTLSNVNQLYYPQTTAHESGMMHYESRDAASKYGPQVHHGGDTTEDCDRTHSGWHVRSQQHHVAFAPMQRGNVTGGYYQQTPPPPQQPASSAQSADNKSSTLMPLPLRYVEYTPAKSSNANQQLQQSDHELHQSNSSKKSGSASISDDDAAFKLCCLLGCTRKASIRNYNSLKNKSDFPIKENYSRDGKLKICTTCYNIGLKKSKNPRKRKRKDDSARDTHPKKKRQVQHSFASAINPTSEANNPVPSPELCPTPTTPESTINDERYALADLNPNLDELSLSNRVHRRKTTPNRTFCPPQSTVCSKFLDHVHMIFSLAQDVWFKFDIIHLKDSLRRSRDLWSKVLFLENGGERFQLHSRPTGNPKDSPPFGLRYVWSRIFNPQSKTDKLIVSKGLPLTSQQDCQIIHNDLQFEEVNFSEKTVTIRGEDYSAFRWKTFPNSKSLAPESVSLARDRILTTNCSPTICCDYE